MINIIIDKQGRPSKGSIFLGNQHENLDETLQFFFPKEYENYYRYIAYCYKDRRTGKKITGISPLVEDAFKVTSAITKCAGMWQLYVICKTTQIDEKATIIDLTANNSTGEHIFISDAINGRISGNEIDIEAFENIAVDENIKILYDDILSLKLRVEKNEATRQTQENIRQTAEANRANAESQRVIAEQSRVDSEGLRTQSEESRVTAESKRVEVEKARVKYETARKQSETLRSTAESKRIETEKSRVSAESLRVSAENERVKSEVLRKQSEQSRTDDEQSRQSAERTRVSEESTRKNAENARVSAEQSRVSVESQRVSAETNRANAERLRSEAETSRINAEQSRADAEQLRVNAENERVTAENLRVEAESKREGVISKLREDLDANTKADARTNRSLTALWDLNNGISYRFEEDNEKAYQKTVPIGAKLGAVNAIGGRTIVWNQLFNYEDITSTTVEGVTFNNNDDGTYTANGTSTGVAYIYARYSAVEGHVYLNRSLTTGGSNITYKSYVTGTGIFDSSNFQTDFGGGAINKALKSGYFYFVPLHVIKGNTADDLKVVPQIYDLTQMFGEGNEPSTIEEFKAMFPNDYYPYNVGELMSMSVNEVDTVGKNIFKCERFSCINFNNIFNPSLSNSYGTSILSVEPSNSVIVTQSKVENVNKPQSYTNGYFCILLNPLILNEKYVFSFDITPSNKLISDTMMYVFINGQDGIAQTNMQDLQIEKKSKLYFNFKANNDRVTYIEIRNGGVSGVFENFQIERGSTNTSFSPYTEKSYPIPQAILELDGYGANGNYVDFAKKEYHKGDEIIDISDIIGDTFQEPFEVEGGGSITFKNTNGDGYQVAVPSEVQYVVSLKEVNP